MSTTVEQLAMYTQLLCDQEYRLADLEARQHTLETERLAMEAERELTVAVIRTLVFEEPFFSVTKYATIDVARRASRQQQH